ncbi:MAG: acylneuraminate cytidylyltransferase family protein [Magnetococcales bacterium]|nr:acylneuraminate cytidylyltransferase family protein [Magnetococcales bacterium]MBF0148830.1 acylneuraminate cytidylyltransferase family protein [Magnetococcales bacterium]MBF0174650.1 acylneuraminate cytidylyltransferase family protein [Magnetococcales bacterium]MBF0346442.1 acylneuraminate cytidylyltransferase family protein [Magnetococcales bacterium]MBF0629835.1 acylneuraminate cytidylyltransferase family protein [Magnetococcales bacterium]
MTTTPKPPRILGMTLARGGSKSVPRKNIRPILGLPLLAYTIREAKKSSLITHYVVSTDDEEIQRVAIAHGAQAPFLRPAHLATDTANSRDPMQHAVTWMETREGQPYDYIIELMATNPMKTVEDIDGCLEKLIATGADSVIAVHELQDHHPMRIKKIIDDRICDFCIPEPPNARRQDLTPKAYIRSGAIYAMRRDHLMIENCRYGSANSRPWYLSPEKAVNVDSMADFLLAEILIKQRQEDAGCAS